MTILYCWWCTLKIENHHSLPYDYDNKNKVFKTFGHFCSWECTKAYNLKDLDSQKNRRMSLITQMYQVLHNETPIIHPSPDKECLKQYGGSLSENEYKKLRSNITTCKQLPFRMISHSDVKHEKVYNYKFIDEDNANKEFNSKPLKNNVNPIKINTIEISPKIGILAFESFGMKST